MANARKTHVQLSNAAAIMVTLIDFVLAENVVFFLRFESRDCFCNALRILKLLSLLASTEKMLGGQGLLT